MGFSTFCWYFKFIFVCFELEFLHIARLKLKICIFCTFFLVKMSFFDPPYNRNHRHWNWEVSLNLEVIKSVCEQPKTSSLPLSTATVHLSRAGPRAPKTVSCSSEWNHQAEKRMVSCLLYISCEISFPSSFCLYVLPSLSQAVSPDTDLQLFQGSNKLLISHCAVWAFGALLGNRRCFLWFRAPALKQAAGPER